MNRNTMRARPWYRHPWPWLLIAIPLLGMILSMITVTMAISGADEDVRDGRHTPLDKSSWRQPSERTR
jgi:hypothetical protein